MKKTLITVACAAAGLILLAGCGEKSEAVTARTPQQRPLSVMLDWFPNADHVGLYQALADGGFSQVGLKVSVHTPSDPALPLKLVAAGRVDLAISYEPELLLARNADQNLVSIAAIVQKPLTSIISIGTKHIKTVSELDGKKVGDAGIAYQHAYLETILAHAGIASPSVQEINVGDNLVPAMLSKRVDATLGGYWNYEAIQLQQLHQHPNIIQMGAVGVPAYDELVLVAKTTTIIKKANELRAFVQALGRGYEAARQNPQAAVANLVKANPGLDSRFQLAAVKATLPVFFPSDASKPWGWQNATEWNTYGQWMQSRHLITNPAAISQAESNDFLAGVGP